MPCWREKAGYDRFLWSLCPLILPVSQFSHREKINFQPVKELFSVLSRASKLFCLDPEELLSFTIKNLRWFFIFETIPELISAIKSLKALLFRP